MDLPPDKLKIVKMLPDEKKIQVLRSLRFVNEKQPPDYYIQALKTYIDVINNQKSHRRSKTPILETSTELIKNLEVSLRTNRIDWVHKFLDPPLNGLDVLIEYLQSTLNFMRECERFNLDSLSENMSANQTLSSNILSSYSSSALGANRVNTNTNRSILNGIVNGNTSTMSTLTRAPTSLSSIASLERRHSRLQKDTRKRMNRVKIGEAADDIHECVRCLRAIMNHQVRKKIIFIFKLKKSQYFLISFKKILILNNHLKKFFFF